MASSFDGITDGHAKIITRAPLSLTRMTELQRHFDLPLQIENTDETRFSQLLAKHYETNSSVAMQMAEDLGESMELADLIHELPQTEDLLEHQDDAPIIRLLNALLGEAIREGASDVHIETLKTGSPSVSVSMVFCMKSLNLNA